MCFIPKHVKISGKTSKFMGERIEKYPGKTRNLLENTTKISGKSQNLNNMNKYTKILGKTPKFSIFSQILKLHLVNVFKFRVKPQNFQFFFHIRVQNIGENPEILTCFDCFKLNIHKNIGEKPEIFKFLA